MFHFNPFKNKEVGPKKATSPERGPLSGENLTHVLDGSKAGREVIPSPDDEDEETRKIFEDLGVNNWDDARAVIEERLARGDLREI